ncbi:tyrosine--tRNA ligase [Candidatus Bathyarchaeota archaeon]|nr:MAG: tyrosine--tRNA ligase [Candidatus Bathyarchaeota archaeon]
MDVGERLGLVTRGAVEVVTRDELRELLESESNPHAYWGFECSGPMHIGMGLVCGQKMLDMVRAGFRFTILLADWHSWINNKLGGDMEAIRLVGRYFRACFEALGLRGPRVRYVWASDVVSDPEYWRKVISIAKSATLRRIRRALPIMGRSLDATDVEAAWLFYPCMQAADIFQLEVDVACAGIDQRKVHMLARDAAEKLGWRKPICLHMPLLMGLSGPEAGVEGVFDEDERLNRRIRSKMSKSVPGGCIFVHDEPEEIRAKLRKAYCPAKQVEDNPVLEIARLIVFPALGRLDVDRPEKYGGPVSYGSYEELERDFASGSLHPLDLKNALADALAEILRPVRERLARERELLEAVKSLEVTR